MNSLHIKADLLETRVAWKVGDEPFEGFILAVYLATDFALSPARTAPRCVVVRDLDKTIDDIWMVGLTIVGRDPPE